MNLAALLNPDRESGVRLVPEAHYVVTYRTRDGGRHRFEHFTHATHFPSVRREVVSFIARRFAPAFVEPGSVAVQRVRRSGD